jgi:hypothetical protein
MENPNLKWMIFLGYLEVPPISGNLHSRMFWTSAGLQTSSKYMLPRICFKFGQMLSPTWKLTKNLLLKKDVSAARSVASSKFDHGRVSGDRHHERPTSGTSGALQDERLGFMQLRWGVIGYSN